MIKVKINFTGYTIMILAFFIPIWEKLVPPVIALLFLLWLIEGDFKNKFQNIIRNRIGLLFILFYLLYVIGLIYTTDMGRGLFDLEVKLSLFIFPVLLLSGSENIQKIDLSRILNSFVIGCLVVSVFLISRALFFYFQAYEIGKLTYINLSYHTSPSYLAMYLNFSVMIIFLSFFKEKRSKALRFTGAFLILFFAVFIILLSSKSGVLTLLFSVLFMFFYLLFRKKYMAVAIMSLISMLMLVLVYKYAKVTIERIKTAIDVSVNYNNISSNSEESTSERILIWEASSNVIKRNPVIGVGTGDVKQELMNEYKKEGISFAIEKSLNAHSQYFQTGIAIGLSGLLVLVLSLIIPLYFAFRSKSWIYVFFLFLFIINLLFESMLERQAGVVFYAFFNALLFNAMYINKYIGQKSFDEIQTKIN
jgi:O-antigen ligase